MSSKGLCLLIALLGISGIVQPVYSEINTRSFDFIAPSVYDTGNAPKQTGSIVYDHLTGGFWGNDGTGMWQPLSQAQSGSVVSNGSSLSGAWPITAGAWGDLTSISLTAGAWEICARVSTANNGALPGAAVLRLGVSTTSGNSAAGLIESENLLSTTVGSTASGKRHSISFCGYIVSPSSTTIYYLKATSDIATNLDHYGYKIVAKRL